MKKFAVMTSIFPPTNAVKDYYARKDWQLVVVGDKKTPENWHYENVIYLSPDSHKGISALVTKNLPWNHYSRKLIGYLFAMQHGADMIADVDDDNLPLTNWGDTPADNDYDLIEQPGFVNIYQFFSDNFIWPRGFPLDKIRQPLPLITRQKEAVEVGVWQFLANGDPDVDAIHRLLFNETVEFKERKPIILNKGSYCPFNSQNTIFFKEAFPLLYLPATVSFRFTDILRGIVAQPILWAHNLRLGFASATAFQDRNPHNYMKDFESEVSMYLNAERAANLAFATAHPENSISINLFYVYQVLAEQGIVPLQELDILKAWIDEVEILIPG